MPITLRLFQMPKGRALKNEKVRMVDVDEKGGGLSAKFLSLFFIAIDVACLVVQAIGIAIVRVVTCSLLSTCTAFLTRRDLRFALAHSPVGHREEQR